MPSKSNTPATEKRINLCFNIDDPQQKAVYSYLKSMGKKKSATVVRAIGKMVVSDAQEKSIQQETDAQMKEILSYINDNNKKSDLEVIQSMFSSIMEKLENMTIVPSNKYYNQGLKENSHSDFLDKKDDDMEMNDDAYNLMMSLFGG